MQTDVVDISNSLNLKNSTLHYQVKKAFHKLEFW